MSGAFVLVLFVAAFIVDYKIDQLAKKRERSLKLDIDVLEYKLIRLDIWCSRIEDDMKKLREELQ